MRIVTHYWKRNNNVNHYWNRKYNNVKFFKKKGRSGNVVSRLILKSPKMNNNNKHLFKFFNNQPIQSMKPLSVSGVFNTNCRFIFKSEQNCRFIFKSEQNAPLRHLKTELWDVACHTPSTKNWRIITSNASPLATD